MPGKFDYERPIKHPQIVGENTEVWNRFILNFPDRFDTVDFDVKVGKGSTNYPIPGEKPREYWLGLTAKRIDVIGWNNDVATIIEVNKKFGLLSLGQIFAHRLLYRRIYPGIATIRTLIICSSIDQDDIDVLNYLGIDFVVV